MPDMTETEIARKMAEFLFTATRGGYGAPDLSPVESAIRRRLTVMTDDIASVLVAENTELRALITSKVQDTIARALRDDVTLNAIVTKSVAEALTRHYSEDA